MKRPPLIPFELHAWVFFQSRGIIHYRFPSGYYWTHFLSFN